MAIPTSVHRIVLGELHNQDADITVLSAGGLFPSGRSERLLVRGTVFTVSSRDKQYRESVERTGGRCDGPVVSGQYVCGHTA